MRREKSSKPCLKLKRTIGFLKCKVCLCVVTGEVTAEELRQRLDGAKERVSSQPHPEPRPQNSEAEGSSGKGTEVIFYLVGDY